MTEVSKHSLSLNALPSHEFSIGEIVSEIDTLQLDQVSAGGGFFPPSFYRAHGGVPSSKFHTVFGPVVSVVAGIAFVVIVIAP